MTIHDRYAQQVDGRIGSVMENIESDVPCRQSLRLKSYSYASQGAYIVTVRTQERRSILCEVLPHGELILNSVGRMVLDQWEKLPDRFPNIELDAFIVMLNHIHAVIWIVGAPLVGALDDEKTISNQTPARDAPTLGNIVGALKSLTTVEYIRGVRQLGWRPFQKRLWQRNYFEHVIRDEKALDRIREYIQGNPANWSIDRDNPHAIKPEPENAWLND
jgi:putative transposase